MRVTAIIAAAGRGVRFGREELKQFVSIGGRPILERSVSTFLGLASIDEVVVALPAELAENPPPYLHHTAKPVRVVPGGVRRQDSVANAFRAASAEADMIVVHDAARPFASAQLIERTIAAAGFTGAALAALAAHDTVKRIIRRSSEAGGVGGADTGAAVHDQRRIVAETLPRDEIYLAQTPQAFTREVLAAALDQSGDATDEASLAERAGHHVVLVEGDPSNIKITTADDLPLAELIASRGDERRMLAIPSAAPARTGRAGTGYDLHRLVEGRRLVVGGVTIPSQRGALGHSDADVVCHAIIDAILGAAALGDIGGLFPSADPQWKDASSLDLLERSAALLVERGFEIGNVDVTVVLETPKLGEHIGGMRTALSRALGIDSARVGVKAKTNEGVDAIGRGEAIAAHAIALVRSR